MTNSDTVARRHATRRTGVSRAAAGFVAALVAAAFPGGFAEAGVLSDTLPPLPDGTALGLQRAEPFLEAPSGPAPNLLGDPNLALIDVVGSLSAAMGRPMDPTVRVLEAGLSPEVAGTIALTLQDMFSCHRITKGHMGAIAPSVLKEAAKENGNGGGLNPSDFKDIRQCAQALWKSTNHLQNAVTKALVAAGPDLDVWPVIRYSRSTANTTYLHDYALVIDAGGNDTYVNNAGANLIDVNYGPPGQPGLKGEGPAVGCARAVAGLANHHCIPSVGVLLDLAGNDRHGIKQTPTVDAENVGDANCTDDLVVRRMMTNGAGFLGVGISIDRSGNDVYTAKTVANGTGHLFGVGVLHDEGGDDTYLEVRNGTGFGLFGGLGVFRDYAGNDVHDFYMPRPKDLTASNQEAGAGGVIDDEDACDNRPRYNVGGGNGAATGVAVDDAGDDSYTGGFSEVFKAPGVFGRVAGGSQGFGENGGTGVLVDGAGADTYEVVNLSEKAQNDGTWARTPYAPLGARSRGNAVTLLPEIDPDTQQGKETGTGGVFHDK